MTATYRVSSVEAFRQWENDDDADTADIVDSIRGLKEPSRAMLAGTAFHKVLELAAPGLETDLIEQDGIVFTFAADFDVEVTPLRELRGAKTYMVDGQPIRISGQVDGLDGRVVIDHKTTARFDPERYLSGYQFRLYLDIFGAVEFRWNIFEISATDEGYEIFAQHRLTQYRYPSMEADCQEMVARFARFVRENIEAPNAVAQ